MSQQQPIPFLPKSESDALALEIAKAFGDEVSLPLYRRTCLTHERTAIYKAYHEALKIPSYRLRKPRRAIFLHILKKYDSQE
ncbi:MAG: hypothetical protein HRF51_00270 [bacterium]|jgi:hypothetical protein